MTEGWQPEIDELKRRMTLARQMGGPENVERQHKSGRLTVRIIDPRDTRPLLTDWVPLAYELEATRLGPKRRGMRP